MSEDRLLDAAEVAARLNLPVTWVRERVRDDSIPHVRLGRYVRFSWPEIAAWLEAQGAGRGRSRVTNTYR
jgi:excisionase family DNA binding protein